MISTKYLQAGRKKQEKTEERELEQVCRNSVLNLSKALILFMKSHLGSDFRLDLSEIFMS